MTVKTGLTILYAVSCTCLLIVKKALPEMPEIFYVYLIYVGLICLGITIFLLNLPDT